MTPRTQKTRALAAAGGLALGSVLPWITASAAFVGTVNVAGTKGDGKLTLVAAGILVLIVLVSGAKLERPAAIVAFLTALGAAGVCVYDLVNISNKTAELEAGANGMATASAGIGLWICVAAAVVATITFGLQLNRRPSARPDPRFALAAPRIARRRSEVKRYLLLAALCAACGSSAAPKVQGTWDCTDGTKITWTEDSWTRAGVTHPGPIDFAAERTSCFGTLGTVP